MCLVRNVRIWLEMQREGLEAKAKKVQDLSLLQREKKVKRLASSQLK